MSAPDHLLGLTATISISLLSSDCFVAFEEQLTLEELLRCSCQCIPLNIKCRRVCELQVILLRTDFPSSRQHRTAVEDCKRTSCSSLQVRRTYKGPSRALLKTLARFRRDHPLTPGVDDEIRHSDGRSLKVQLFSWSHDAWSVVHTCIHEVSPRKTTRSDIRCDYENSPPDPLPSQAYLSEYGTR